MYVTYNSDPQGAILYSGGQAVGYTPKTAVYAITEKDRKREHMILQGTKVIWASGAEAEISKLRADLHAGSYQQFTFVRPAGCPGRVADIRFALELEKNNILKEQGAASEAQASKQMYNAINQQYLKSTARHCTSNVTGNRIITTCQ